MEFGPRLLIFVRKWDVSGCKEVQQLISPSQWSIFFWRNGGGMGGSGPRNPRNGWVSCRWIVPPEERFGCVCKWGIYHGIPQSGNCTWKNPEKSWSKNIQSGISNFLDQAVDGGFTATRGEIGHANVSSPVVILQDQVPAVVKALFEQRLQPLGPETTGRPGKKCGFLQRNTYVPC